MGGVRMRPWWWLVTGGVVAVGAGLFALEEGSTPWLVLAFVAACASPALPFVARWWADRERTRVERQAVDESSVLRDDTNGPSSLLAPDHQVVPFQGRSVELAALVGWCDSQNTGQRIAEAVVRPFSIVTTQTVQVASAQRSARHRRRRQCAGIAALPVPVPPLIRTFARRRTSERSRPDQAAGS